MTNPPSLAILPALLHGKATPAEISLLQSDYAYSLSLDGVVIARKLGYREAAGRRGVVIYLVLDPWTAKAKYAGALLHLRLPVGSLTAGSLDSVTPLYIEQVLRQAYKFAWLLVRTDGRIEESVS